MSFFSFDTGPLKSIRFRPFVKPGNTAESGEQNSKAHSNVTWAAAPVEIV
jgi:hypothetical protein